MDEQRLRRIREAEHERRAERADGCHAPKIMAASAMNPLPATISIWKLPATESCRYEPARPEIRPAMNIAR